jgi:hypothetical protein
MQDPWPLAERLVEKHLTKDQVLWECTYIGRSRRTKSLWPKSVGTSAATDEHAIHGP